jgi:hypothetical protein
MYVLPVRADEERIGCPQRECFEQLRVVSDHTTRVGEEVPLNVTEVAPGEQCYIGVDLLLELDGDGLAVGELVEAFEALEAGLGLLGELRRSIPGVDDASGLDVGNVGWEWESFAGRLEPGGGAQDLLGASAGPDGFGTSVDLGCAVDAAAQAAQIAAFADEQLQRFVGHAGLADRGERAAAEDVDQFVAP